MFAEKALDGFFTAVEHDAYVSVTRNPHIMEELCSLLLGDWSEGVAQLIESLAKRSAPLLVETGLAAVASAVGAPAFDAVHAAPGCIFDDFAFVLRSELGEEAGVVDELDCLVFLEHAQRIGKRHFAVLVVVAI